MDSRGSSVGGSEVPLGLVVVKATVDFLGSYRFLAPISVSVSQILSNLNTLEKKI